NATSQGLVLFGAPKEDTESFNESKTTNTEGVNTGIYFSYPSRRHSCALVNIPAPCVNKMISHIQDVESKIQVHLKRFETSFEEWRRTSSTKDLKEDWSVTISEKEVKPEERDAQCPELKQEMETLLSEAIHLIKSLETDRADAEEALKEQRSRKKLINMKIDSWSTWKLQELPSAVQKEHEAYLRDIIELQWHLERKANQLEHLEKQKARLQETNAKIQTDTDYMNEHILLLGSKWNKELKVLKERYKKKFEVMELYREVHDKLRDAIDGYDNVKWKAKQIKEDMEKDICKDEKDVEDYKKEIDKLNSLYNHYQSLIQNVNTDIKEKKEQVTETIEETKSSTSELSVLSKMLDGVKAMYDQLTWRQKSYKEQYLETLNSFYAAEKSWNIELSNVTKDFTELSIALEQLMEENRKLGIDLDSIKHQIKESIRKKGEFESEIKTLLKMKLKYNEYIKDLYKEANHIGTIFYLNKHKTEEMEDKIAEARRKFKGREDFLKRLIRGEVITGMIIQKRLYSIHEVQIQERQELLKRKAIYAITLSEIQEPLLQLEEDAERIRAIHKEHSDALNSILEKKDHIRRNVQKTKKKLRKRERKTRVALTETESKGSVIFKELETTKSKTILFHAKINELEEELKAKEEEKNYFDQILEALKNKFITIRFKKEHAQAVFDHLMQERKNCKMRIFEEDQRFRTLFAMRQKTLDSVR
ncbi:coiled-coil domain-containing protein 178, partial [Carlito syrichta]|uniref:Coiled-coil domain-containing protein 178 n=1 Tax=Carlito syrichta TaxID=1868482 RepID=A0A1U7TDC8_CARSF